MTLRNLVPLTLGAFAVFMATRADAASPFTIRRPPDGATVREKVRVEMPKDSIPEGGFVAFYIDDKFYVALAPKKEDTTQKSFTFVWDTKEAGITEGEHSIKAVMYEPTANSTGNIAVTEKAISEVKLTVANKIKDGPKSLLLRYKYRDGANLTYNRDSKSLVVGGVSPNGMTTSDQILSSMKSKFQLGVEDARPAEDVALVRNKMTSLSVLTDNQETNIPTEQLSGSMFQELNSKGKVIYETGGQDLGGLTAEGQPISTTLQLPLLPEQRITVGSTWKTASERLDVPGLPPQLQPRAALSSKFEGLEWEGGFKTAKIHQEAKVKLPAMTFGAIEITAPEIQYERDIYVGYTSGTLVKTVRTITVTGRTLSDIGAPPPVDGGGGSMMSGGAGGAPNFSSGVGLSGRGGGSVGGPPMGYGGMMRPPGPGGMGGSMGGRGGGRRAGGGSGDYDYGGGGSGGYPRPGSGGGGMGGSMGGRQSGPPSGYMGMMAGGSMGGRQGSGMMRPPGPGGSMGGMMGGIPGQRGNGGAMGNGPTTDATRPITLKSIAETEFQSAMSGQTASR